MPKQATNTKRIERMEAVLAPMGRIVQELGGRAGSEFVRDLAELKAALAEMSNAD